MTNPYHNPPFANADMTALAPRRDPVFTGTVTLPSGTSALPGSVFASDDDTGLCSPAADELAISTAGKTRAHIAADGTIRLGMNASGGEGLRVVTASPVANRLEGRGGASGAAPRLSAQGADASIDLVLAGKGQGRIIADGPLVSRKSTADAPLSALLLSDISTADDMQLVLFGGNLSLQRRRKSDGAFLSGVVNINSAAAGVAITVNAAAQVAVGTIEPNEALTVGGALSLSQTAAPAATAGYGKLYVKTDGRLYFKNASGIETCLTP